MKLLVLAQTPPPLHGQSFMVQTLIEGLPAQGIEVCHVPLPLSRDHADIGRWRPGKVLTAWCAGRKARRLGRSERCDALYYVPAPGKRGALWRDFITLGAARGACRRRVLHFHAAGMGAWLNEKGTACERNMAGRVLGHADLAIVLTDSLRTDALALNARHTAVVPNGIADPCPAGATRRARGPDDPLRLLFLGMCSAEKGVFVLLDAMARLRAGGARVELTVAGAFPGPREESIYRRCAASLGNVRHVGFVAGPAKTDLLRATDVLCLPTFYPHEAQPLVLLEALAHDLPIVATKWRGIAETLPAGNPLVAPRNAAALAEALAASLRVAPAPGANRAHFLSHFTRERHLVALKAALLPVSV